MNRTTLACLALTTLLSHALWAQPAEDVEEAPPAPPPSLAESAAAADLIALVQVMDTDYEMVRDFPRGGTAFLRVLIPYKVSRPLEDLIEVYEEGLHEHECYFPTPDVTEEGQRFLVFLAFNPDVEEQYIGLPNGCAFQSLVLSDNSYVLRYPLASMSVSDDASADALPREFQDSHAVFADDDMTVAERNGLLAGGYLEETDEGYRFTHGIDLAAMRRMIGPDNLTLDRPLRRLTTPETITE